MNLIILDSFGINMTFYLKGFKDYRSHLGGFVTLSIYVISIICACIFAGEFWKKSTPKISTASSIYPNPTKLDYPNDIFFMFTVSVDSIPFLDNKIYRPIGHIQTKINGTESFYQKNISLEICSTIFNESYKYYESIKHLNLSNFYCLSLDKNNETENGIFINEFWGNEGFQMLQIKIYNCSAVAENKSECETNDIIREKLKSLIITYYTLNNYIDTNNYKNPYVRGIKDNFYYVSYKKFYSVTQYLKHVEIHSDVGLLFSSIEINADNTIDSMVEYSENDQEDGKIFTMSIQLTNKIDVYNRSYYKIQDLGADVGAIYGALHMVFAILFQFYNNSKLFTNIMNSFFLIKEDFKPISREKKAFINLKTKFYNDLKLNISIDGKNNETKSEKKSNDEYMKTNDCLTNENMRKIFVKNDKMYNIIETKNNYIAEQKINDIKNDDEAKKNSILKILKNKREEEKKRIRIDFSCIDRFFCLYFIDLCRNRANTYSFYNLFYKGKDYIIKVLDITNYLKYNHFLQMFFLINGKEKKDLYDYVTTPILSCNYVGPRFEAEKQ